MNRGRELLGNMYILLISMTTLVLIDVSMFKVYSRYALYVNLLFIAVAAVRYNVKLNRDMLVFIVILMIYLLFSIVVSEGGLGSVITLITPFLMLTVFSNLQFTLKAKKRLYRFGVIVLLFLVLYSISYGENYPQYSLVKINPNTLGMFVMFLFMMISICGDFNKKRSKLFGIILFGLSILGIYNYRARATTFALCCYALMLLIPHKWYTRKRFVFFVIVAIVAGTAFPFIYLHLYESEYALNIFGKSLYTGREDIWGVMFSLLKNNELSMFFGLGSKTVLWEKDLNVHNNFFNIIVNFGLIGYVMHYGFIIINIWKNSKHIYNPVVKKGLSMFVCSVLLLGFTETTSLWATIFPLAYFGLIVSNSTCLQEGFSNNVSVVNSKVKTM